MNILIITGSPRKKGTSVLLTEQFIKGAEKAGHTVHRFDAAFKKVHPCIACDKCRSSKSGCVFKDDMTELNPLLLNADAVVFVSPIYYYDLNAQIKAVIDRFYANDSELHTSKKSALMLTFADTTMESANGAIETYKGMVNFLGWNSKGIIAAKGCYTAEDIKNTDYLREAYELGLNM